MTVKITAPAKNLREEIAKAQSNNADEARIGSLVSDSIDAVAIDVESLSVGTQINVPVVFESGADTDSLTVKSNAGVNNKITLQRGTTDVGKIEGSFDGMYLNGHQVLTLQTASTERVRVDINGNLMVGKTTAGLDVAGIELSSASDYASITRSSGTPLFVTRQTNDGELISLRKDGVPVGNIAAYSGELHIDADTGLRFEANALLPKKSGAMNDAGVALGSAAYRYNNLYLSGAAKAAYIYNNSGLYFGSSNVMLPTNSTGGLVDATVGLGDSARRFTNLYLSGGVYLGGTGAANHLDDYEEGTFTPVVEGQTTAGSGTYSEQLGGYTKIGNLVRFSLRLVWSAHTGTGNLIISGLPFSEAETSTYAAATVHYSGLAVTGDYVSALVITNKIYPYDAVAGATTQVPMDTAATLFITGTYMTA